MRRPHPCPLPGPRLTALPLTWIFSLTFTLGCATIEEPLTRCDTTSTPTTGTLSQDILGPWLSDNRLTLLTFSPDGRWHEHPLSDLSPLPSPSASGTYLTSPSTLTLRSSSNQRREHIQVLPDRLIVWISDDANAPLTYWRARCTPTPPHIPGAPP
jgi:hypothetical protein